MAENDAFEVDSGPNDGDSASYVVRVGSKNYAVGLIWADVEDKAEAASEARAAAARPDSDADLFCVRQLGAQYGLGSRTSGHQKNMPSLGGLIADSRSAMQGSLVGLFELKDGSFYLIVVRDGMILGLGDKVFVDESRARSAFEDVLRLSDWAEIYAPESMGFANSQEIDLEGLTKSGKAPRLTDVDRVSGVIKWGGVALVALAVVFGGLFYMNHLNEVEYQEEMRRLAEAAARQLPGRSEQVVEVPPMPWEGKFVAAQYLPACAQAMKQAVLAIPGWKPLRIECDGNGRNVTMTIERLAGLGSGGGTINWVRWALDRSAIKSASATPTGQDTVAISWQIPGTLDQYKPELDQAPPPIGESRRYVQSWLEETFTPVVFPTSGGNTFFDSVSFRFETPYDPSRFGAIIGKVPGSTITKVAIDLRQQPYRYQVEGALHYQKPLPPEMKVAPRPGTRPPTAAAPAQTPRT